MEIPTDTIRTQRLVVKNFGGMKEADISLNHINIFIGKQASGKSVVLKLVYFFYDIFHDIITTSLNSVLQEMDEHTIQPHINDAIIERFQRYFPEEAWTTQFELQYWWGKESVTIVGARGAKQPLNIVYSEGAEQVFIKLGRTLASQTAFNEFPTHKKYFQVVAEELHSEAGYRQFFISAGRSFFPQLQRSVFSLLAANVPLDPFVVLFGELYEQSKLLVAGYKTSGETDKAALVKDRVKGLEKAILGGTYQRTNQKDYVLHDDGRKIPLHLTSTGQQEALPLLSVIQALMQLHGSNMRVFIEEPETHLFPEGQRHIVELLALLFNYANSTVRLCIATHSPYILTAFNLLLQAGMLSEQYSTSIEEYKQRLERIVPNTSMLKPGVLSAFVMRDGGVYSLMDEDTGLISAEYLDSVSENLAEQFDALMEMINA